MAGAKLVETGSFRIDHRRALKKLKRFRAPMGFPGWIPWVRCAVSRGATNVSINQGIDWVQISFDGKPFTRRELRDPYGGLFEDGAAAGRRNFALGLLGILNSGAKLATVTSGKKGGRLRLFVRTLEDFTLQEGGEDGGTTVLMKWPWYNNEESGRLRAHGPTVAKLCAMSPIPIRVSGKKFAPAPSEGAGTWKFSGKGVRGSLSVPAYMKPHESRIELFCGGVRVKSISRMTPLVKVGGRINCDAFKLNISQTGVVENRVYADALRTLERSVEPFLRDVVSRHSESLAKTGRLLHDNGWARSLWKHRFRWGPAAKQGLWVTVSEVAEHLFGSGGKKHGGTGLVKLRVFSDARVTLWLRDACQRLLLRKLEKITPKVRDALLGAPVLLDPLGRPLSLKDMGYQERIKRVHYVLRPFSKAPRSPVVWCVAEEEVFWLKRFFGGLVTRTTQSKHFRLD